MLIDFRHKTYAPQSTTIEGQVVEVVKHTSTLVA